MLIFFTTVHLILCVVLVGVILLQPGKDAGMGAALGGGSATSAFGGRGAATILTKMTAACAVLFFVTSLGLSFVGLRTSVVAGVMAPTDVKTTEGAAPTETSPAALEKGATDSAPGKAPATEAAPNPIDAVPSEKLPTP
jgi:preprotein translocase subunit SecG